jgi:hypothetical protein
VAAGYLVLFTSLADRRGFGKAGDMADRKRKAATKVGRKQAETRARAARPYPASSFAEAMTIGKGIMKHAAGQKVRRLTLLEKMEKSPNSSGTKMAITNSGKYGITKGSYAADYLELTDAGRIVVDETQSELARRKACFDLSIKGVRPFEILYQNNAGKRLPAKEVLKDQLQDSDVDVPDLEECVDTFIVNSKDAGLLKTIGGAETLVSIEDVLEGLPAPGAGADGTELRRTDARPTETASPLGSTSRSKEGWEKICFYISPIGEENTEQRKHADLFVASLVEPAVRTLGLELVRADKIGSPGVITSQVIEHLRRAALAIADLSYLNPNVFWEMALRHACRLPTVQIIRKADRIPYDVNQVRSVVIDTSDIYTLIPRLETYQAEIATQAREALADPESVGNPITVFFPEFFERGSGRLP